MALDQETKRVLQGLQAEAGEILGDITAIFPTEYRFTLIARHSNNVEDADIVLTNDYLDDAIAALERNKVKMENAE